MPVLYLPHGGGPCFFMDWRMGPRDTWNATADWLRRIPETLPGTPTALLVISAHWEESEHTVTASPSPPLLYDYVGFPEHTYALKWPAAGSPELCGRVQALLDGAGIPCAKNSRRGLDHGVFVPLLLPWPNAAIPTVQISLKRGLNPEAHMALGRALEPLRDEGVFIIGSGMSYHNMRGFGRHESLPISQSFDRWLSETVTFPALERSSRLAQWTEAPHARACHPREEHLLPLMVVSGAAGLDQGRVVFTDEVMGVAVSAHQFG